MKVNSTWSLTSSTDVGPGISPRGLQNWQRSQNWQNSQNWQRVFTVSGREVDREEDRVANPFKPSAGSTPPLLVGRTDDLEDFAEALDDGPGAPGRLAFVTGARGVGKTVMLTKMGEIAEERGWSVVHDTATGGLIDRLTRAVRMAREDTGVKDRARTSEVAIGVPNVLEVRRGFAHPPADPHDLRIEIGRLLDSPIMRDYGLLITIDEIHTIGTEELEQLAAITQHLIREDRNIALVMAGIPQAVDHLIADNAQRPRVSTFLRRADMVLLGKVDETDVAESFLEAAHQAGRHWDPEIADLCAAATGGYPFMIQLVGYHTWRAARGAQITREHAERGIAVARRKIGQLVHAPALQDLSDVDKTILVAMSQDEEPSRAADIAARIDRNTSYVSVYKGRLERAGMIEIHPNGLWEFAAPELREYLRQHAAHIALASPRTPSTPSATLEP